LFQTKNLRLVKTSKHTVLLTLVCELLSTVFCGSKECFLYRSPYKKLGFLSPCCHIYVQKLVWQGSFKLFEASSTAYMYMIKQVTLTVIWRGDVVGVQIHLYK